MTAKLALAVIVAAVTGACDLTEPSGDPFPVHVDLTTGPVLVHLATPGTTPVAATLDVLAPFTLFDPGPDATVSRESTDVDLFGERTPGSADLVERAVFSVDVVRLHPCDDATTSCTVGAPAAPTTIGAVLGADALGTGAVRFDFPNSNLFVFPDIAGADDLRDAQCDARFPSPFRGGGTLVLGGADVDFNGTRVAVGACLGTVDYQATAAGTSMKTATAATAAATEVLFVVSTGIGPTLLGATAYARYYARRCGGTAPPATGCADPAALAQTSVLLPSGPISGGAATIVDLALVANPSGTSRGPCTDLYANHCLPGASSTCFDQAEHDVLCKNMTTCSAPATAELSPAAGFDVIVVDDADPTLQALRAELRPDQPEVDGILGTDALRMLQLDVDYPNNRLLARCGAGATDCKTFPTLGDANSPLTACR